MKLLEQFRTALGAGVPIVAIETSDPAQTIGMIVDSTKAGRFLSWDLVHGLMPINKKGQEVLLKLASDLAAATGITIEEAKQALAQQTLNPTECVTKFITSAQSTDQARFTWVSQLPEMSVIFMHNALSDQIINNGAFLQAVWNLRDPFKQAGNMVVLLGPQATIPRQLRNDVIILEHPYPKPEELLVTVNEVADSAGVKDAAVIKDASVRLVGCNNFSAEQLFAMSMTGIGSSKVKVDMDELETSRIRKIEETKGLSVIRNGVSIGDVMNCDNFLNFAGRMMKGKKAPTVVILMDELEKSFAAANTESSGTTQDALMVTLKGMQTYEWDGSILMGVPGSGKTFSVNAIANSNNIILIDWDFGAMKGGIVGESEQNVREAMRVVEAIRGDGSVFAFATCNKDAALPPELKRRFGVTFFFDCTVTPEGLAKLWSLYTRKYSITGERAKLDFDCEGWTGAEIKKCCNIADKTGLPLSEAAKFITPVWKQARNIIESGRKQAQENGYISAAYEGSYVHPEQAKNTSGRKFSAA